MRAQTTHLHRQSFPESISLVTAHARRLSSCVNPGDPDLPAALEAAGLAAWRDTAATHHLYAGTDARMFLAQRIRAAMLAFLRQSPQTHGLMEGSES